MEVTNRILFALVLELFGVILTLGDAWPFGFLIGGIGLVVASNAVYRTKL